MKVFAQRNPRYLLRIVNRHDEFFALVMFFVERHYLTAWGTLPLSCLPLHAVTIHRHERLLTRSASQEPHSRRISTV